MSEKKMNARILHKHDTEANWNKATGFIPKEGELIIYDVDNNHSKPRFKVGDGKKSVIDLPFAGINLHGVEFKDNSMNIPYKENYDETGTIGLGTYEYTIQSDNDLIVKLNDDYNNYNAPLLTMRAIERGVGSSFETTLGDNASEWFEQGIDENGGDISYSRFITNIRGTDIDLRASVSQYDDIDRMITPDNPAIKITADGIGWATAASIIDIEGLQINIKANDRSGGTKEAIKISTTYDIDEGTRSQVEAFGEFYYNGKEVATKEDITNATSNVVTSVNGKSGPDVVLTAKDINGALTKADFHGVEFEEGSITIPAHETFNEFGDSLKAPYNVNSNGELNVNVYSDYDAKYINVLSAYNNEIDPGATIVLGSGRSEDSVITNIIGSEINLKVNDTNAIDIRTDDPGDDFATININGELLYNGNEVATKADLNNIDIPEVNLDNVLPKNGEVDGIDIRFKNIYTEGDAYSVIQTAGDGIVFGYDGGFRGMAPLGDKETVVSGRHTTIEVVTEEPVLGPVSCPAINVEVDPETTGYGDPSAITKISGKLLYNDKEVATVDDISEGYELIEEDTHEKRVTIKGAVTEGVNTGVYVTGDSAGINDLIGSHIEGYSTTNGANLFPTGASANDVISEWEGSSNKGFSLVAGMGSHVEGINNLVVAEGAHAEGNQNLVQGNYSHAEGRDTVAGSNELDEEGNAIAWFAHAEGVGTQALGRASHSEGDNTIAGGRSSHAEGCNTTASDHYTHAEGYGTKATKGYAHAEGQNTSAIATAAHAEGSQTTASSPRAHAEGYVTTASGGNAHAEGARTQATGSNSHAEGEYTEAKGDYTHAEGRYTIAGGRLTHAEGYKTEVYGENSHIEGLSSNRASSMVSNLTLDTDENTIKTAWESNKFALVLTHNAHGEGRDNLVFGECSHAEGRNNIAGNKTSGWYAHAEGKNTMATGNASHSEGINTEATGAVSHAEGSNTTASGDWSHSEGADTQATNVYAHAEGYGTIASAEASHASGYNTRANEPAQFVCGSCNADENSALFIVGASKDPNNRTNCFSTGTTAEGEAYLKVGDTQLTESQLQSLLALLDRPYYNGEVTVE